MNQSQARLGLFPSLGLGVPTPARQWGGSKSSSPALYSRWSPLPTPWALGGRS
ncbi:hypothetical protein DAI22_01g105100 [Oryza sativa Japonica Group]|nr:hypothetical protein DAI22_01g105100 [Oryza sativa Japonica Group]